MSSDFYSDFAASRQAEKHPTVVAALRDAFPSALQVHRAHQQNDQLGVDCFLEYPGARMYRVDLKIRRIDYAARRGAPMDIVLELTFGDAPGWAMRSTKAEGYLFVCLDTGRSAAFAAEAVRLVLERNLITGAAASRSSKPKPKPSTAARRSSVRRSSCRLMS